MKYKEVFSHHGYPAHWVALREDGGLDLVPANARGRPVVRVHPGAWETMLRGCVAVSFETNRLVLERVNGR